MLNEDVLNALPEAIYQRLNKINTAYLQLIGQKVKEIGKMSPEDLRKLQRIQTYNGDIERELEHAIDKSASEVYEMIDAVAKDMYTDAKPAYDKKGIKYVPYEENKELQKYVESISRQTVGEFNNITQHTAFCVWGKDGESVNTFFDENRNKIPTSLSETYTRVIDEAVTAAQMGVTDYNSAIRKTLRTISDSGIRIVDYATGYSRRLDTAVRQNVLWGIKQCCMGTAEQLGEEIGGNGWEISYHSNARPTHVDMGGRQYAAGNKGVTVKGKYYPPFSEVENLLKDYNCLHYKSAIILGVSEPTYSDEELAAMKANDAREFEYEGKTYTGYEASQVQRKLETEIRKQKDRANLFAASGDDDGRRQAQEKINLLTKKYKDFSDAAGLPYKTERMSVAKYHRVKTATELKRSKLTKNVGSGIIKTNRRIGLQFFADIPESKFLHYALDMEKQPDKARAFRDALGYTKENYKDLIENIRVNVDEKALVFKASNSHGKLYEYVITLKGPNGKSANVCTGWIIENGKAEPRLTSVYVTKKEATKHD